ncbi:hypothetical protein [Lysinibacillus pakistanensis]|uniref:Uncharacterized protein n=1 Tax=Lysinibacillus pakistanensis TaxID=759811 RepID=A0AAX3X397_9BACI|nr:hypothetical protein [Lysinibacillus pakistanensis]MDM5232898.1 hypothetical protein [Lysinibacillus pakistanensis]WHY48391.1 hypothetical protein QNH22_09290 [Lysinibacillus pakistanensis]WHY53404.1 hypothetical protein QNH24_09275 [Lysinibacillus pakistanensis]
MGNRTFLSVTNADTDLVDYENTAFETNNFLAPVWFCLVSQEQFQRYSGQLMQAWSKIQPYLEQPDIEDLPEWECFSEAFQWQIPWVDAAEQLRLSLPGTLAHFPSLAAPVYEWLETLSTHIQRYSAAVIHLELSQYFSFTGDPVLYLKDIEEYVNLWQSPHPSQEKVWQGAADNFYMLNGEHFPWRERVVAQPEQAPEIQPVQSIPPASEKRQPKWQQELYIWLLAILSAALFLIVYVNTSSGWLAVLGFLIPSMFIVLWNMIIGPKKTARHLLETATTVRRSSTPSYAVLRIEYFGGHSHIGVGGMDTGALEDKSLPNLIPWLQIMQAKVLSSHEVELMISAKNLPVSTLQLHLDEQLVATDIVSAVNAIVLAHKMSV